MLLSYDMSYTVQWNFAEGTMYSEGLKMSFDMLSKAKISDPVNYFSAMSLIHFPVC